MIRKLDKEFQIRLVEELRKPLNLDRYDKVNVEVDGNRLIITKLEDEPEVNLVPPVNERLNNIIETFKDKPVLEHIVDLDETKEVRIIPETKRKKDRISYDLPDFKGTDIIQVLDNRDNVSDDYTEIIRCGRCSKLVEPNCNIKINGKLICRDCIIDFKNQLKRDIKR